MLKKIILIGTLTAGILLFSGCQNKINIPTETTQSTVSIVDVMKDPQLQYPAENESFYYNVYDNFVAITKYIGSGERTVVIPDTLENLPVYVIGPEAFEGADFENLIISENIYTIGGEAFKDCKNLKVVVFEKTGKLPEGVAGGNGVVEIGENAFDGCFALTQITLPNSVETIGEACFNNCISLEEMVVPPLVTELPKDFCGGCSSLKNVYIGETVTDISSIAFRYIPSDTYFHGKPYSAAAVFAAENFYSFVIMGEEKPEDNNSKEEVKETTTTVKGSDTTAENADITTNQNTTTENVSTTKETENTKENNIEKY